MLQVLDVGKSFGGVSVLAGVSLDIRPGQIHTIMGENGAGKSTLMKIIAGVHRPDVGRLVFNGQEARFPDPQAALRAGITLIHQEPLSFPDLTVAENVLFAHGLPTTFPARVDWAAMNARVEKLFATLGVRIDPRRKMRGMSVADQQMVELAAALAGDAKVLLMDEPTAALTPGEVDRLFAIVRKLKSDGVAIVFVSHRLPEVFDVSDQITVLRDGNFIATKNVSETTPQEIVKLMVGRELASLSIKEQTEKGEVLLELDNVRRAGGNAAVSLTVRAGEIVGLAGLVGAGRTELAEALFGLRPIRSGAIRIRSETTPVPGTGTLSALALSTGAHPPLRTVHLRSPAAAIRHGLAYVPEDRAHHGLLLPLPISLNTSLADLSAVSTAGVLFTGRERSLAETWRDRLKIRLHNVDQPVRQLSGGNQQKVVLAKWLETNPKILIIDEPTRGVDVGAKSEVHRLMTEHARNGGAVLMISSDLPEVLTMSDRILVMRNNAIVAELPGEGTTQELVMAHATGTAGEVLSAESKVPRESPAPRAHGSPRNGATAAPGTEHPPSTFDSALSTLSRFRELGVLAFLLLALALAFSLEPRFRSLESLQKIALYVPLILIVAIGQMMVIVSRYIDLSVGSTLGLASIVSCGIFVSHPHTPLLLAFPIAIVVGALAGTLNGTLVAYLRVPAIIATLATLTAYRGLIFIWSGARQVDPDKLPESLLHLTQSNVLGLPYIVWIAALTALLAWYFLGHTVRGRQVYALGGNPDAALLRGIRVRRVTVQIFAICGALAGLAGILFGSRFGTVNPGSVGVEMELVTISAVVIGGAAVAGGAGSVLGTLLGCLLLGVINVAMIMHGVSELWQLVVYGAAILLACLLDASTSALARRAR